MKHLDLFSGIGGFALAARWAGIETVAFCEIEEFPRKVLNKNFQGIPIHHDIRELDGSEYEGIDIITGGYPCQPFSKIGSRKGASDPRHLWPDMLRIIKQAKPSWVVCENVLGHVSMGLDAVLDDFKNTGYETRQFIIPACAVGSPQERKRVWVVAHSASVREQRAMWTGNSKAGENESGRGQQNGGFIRDYSTGPSSRWSGEWGSNPRVCRVGNGIPDRVDRIKGLGNAIVPQVAFEILKAILEANKCGAEGD